MTLFIINLWLLISMQDIDPTKVNVGGSAKQVIENVKAYSSKEPIDLGNGYSAKSGKEVIELPEKLPDVLDRPPTLLYPPLPPLPPINPPKVTEINPR